MQIWKHQWKLENVTLFKSQVHIFYPGKHLIDSNCDSTLFLSSSSSKLAPRNTALNFSQDIDIYNLSLMSRLKCFFFTETKKFTVLYMIIWFPEKDTRPNLYTRGDLQFQWMLIRWYRLQKLIQVALFRQSQSKYSCWSTCLRPLP